MVTATEARTRTRVEIHYDADASEPLGDAPFGTLVNVSGRDVQIDGEWVRDAYGVGARRLIHEHMRGVKVAARVDVPNSYTDRPAGDAFMYATREDVIREYGAYTPQTRESARQLLAACAAEWRAWADGCSFGFVLTRERQCPTCGQWEETDSDSVWGFTTRDPEHDLLDWMGEYMDEDGRAALASALEQWTGEYPIAARGES